MSEKEVNNELETSDKQTFTREELESLNFSPEELEIIESANAYVEATKMLSDDVVDELITKLDTEFPMTASREETFEKLNTLCETDPDFIAQLAIFQEILSNVEFEQPEEK